MDLRLTPEIVLALVACLGFSSNSPASGSSGHPATARSVTTDVRSPSREVLATETRLTVRVTPLMVLVGSDARGLITVPRHSENRLVRVILESVDYYSSSDVPLDGANAAQNHFFYWRQLPPGSYEVTVEVYGVTGLRESTRVHAPEAKSLL